MASGLLKEAGAKRERRKLDRAADAGRDPAEPDLPENPTWETSQDGENASDSASGKASESAGEEASEPGGDYASEKEGENAGGKDVPPADVSPEPPAAPSSVRPARRRGRPRGPDRVKLSVRIRTDLDEMLSEAVERTQLSPQYIVEEALARHFRALGIKRR